MNSQNNIKEESITAAIEQEDQKNNTYGSSVTNGLEDSNINLIPEEDEPTPSILPPISQTNAVDSSESVVSKDNKGNIDASLNIFQFNINSQDIYDKETENRKSLSKGINNSFLNEIKESKEIVTMEVPIKESKEKQENVNQSSANLDNPIASFSISTTKKKRGRPRKGTFSPKRTDNQHLVSKHRKVSSNQSFYKKYTHIKVEINGSENETSGNPKRRRRSRKMKDYITEFQSSDDEEDTKSYNTPVNKHQQSRGLSGRINKQNHIKDTNICNMDINDSFIYEKDFLNESSLELSESDSEITQSSQIEDSKHILEIVPEKKNKLEIINTGEMESIEGKDRVSTSQKSKPTSSVLSSSEKNLKGKLQRSYKRKLIELKQKVNLHLREMRRGPPQSLSVPELLNAASKFLTEDQIVFLSMQLKTKHEKVDYVRFSVREKLLSLALYQQSPSVYKYLRTLFHLPNKIFLEQWLECIAKVDPLQAKRLMYHVYAKYIYRV
ncbi:unnamed protein product [Meganyctiphanes norvegica]|uniref:Uncharacterized protein n=1 Tax=Meganyctiphanes norvegica TaxID=48144 RepID=A0AAV2SS08_MEGNR